MVYFVIDIASRKVQIAGIDEAPNEEWMLQVARNLTDSEHGFLKDKRFLIHDRDPLFAAQFRKTLKAGGVVRWPARRRGPGRSARPVRESPERP